ncbi:MAG: sensor histidine kinase [Aquabacterium sp.]
MLPVWPTLVAAVRRRPPRALLWGLLLLLLAVAQTLLVVLTIRYEAVREQDRAEAFTAVAIGELRQRAQQLVQGLQAMAQPQAGPADVQARAQGLMSAQRELVRVEWRDAQFRPQQAVNSPWRLPIFNHWPRADMQPLTEAACAHARRGAGPAFSRSHYVPQSAGLGLELMDLCAPVQSGGQVVGYLVGTIVLADLLQQAMPAGNRDSHELSFVEADGARLARAGPSRGAGVFVAERLVDLSGAPLVLRADSLRGRPDLIPNLATALVLGLSAALLALVLLLARDVRRRARVEAALAEALAFRKAMEDSLITGLRARALDGRISYVNPAFCAMVGYSAETLQQARTPPYWPPDLAPVYAARQAERLAAGARDPAREGFETQFMRADGTRFPVAIYEAPLVDGQGRHAGWMSAVLDISAQRRAEDLARAQADKLAASARLASMGEMASLISHELNQPLAAIASYAAGSLNLLEPTRPPQPALLQEALSRIAEQADRAGRVIRSVQDFVRRREPARQAAAPAALLEGVLPLVRLQARKLGAELSIDCPATLPRVVADRTMIEQVLLNLARNGLQAMETLQVGHLRTLTLRVRPESADDAGGGPAARLVFEVADTGPGISADVAQRLFTPFFTTRDEGLGLGLSLCRTVVEQHGGALTFGPALEDAAVAAAPGTTFRFTLPTEPRAASDGA